MTAVLGGKKRNKKVKPATEIPVAHILTPAHRLDAAKRGEKVTALCGAVIKGDPDPKATGICQECTVLQFKQDDVAADERAQARYDAGKEAGATEKQRALARELQALAQNDARQARQALEEPRFESPDDKTIKFTFQDGSVATMRKSRIGSVLHGPNGQGYELLVDGRVVIAHEDPTLVQLHHRLVHEAVFGIPPS